MFDGSSRSLDSNSLYEGMLSTEIWVLRLAANDESRMIGVCLRLYEDVR
jgi:hypothetical protein